MTSGYHEITVNILLKTITQKCGKQTELICAEKFYSESLKDHIEEHENNCIYCKRMEKLKKINKK